MPPKRRRRRAGSGMPSARPQSVVKRKRDLRARGKETKDEEPILQTSECEQADQRPTLPIFPDFLYLVTEPEHASKPSHLITKPKTSSEEQKCVDKVKALVLQAYRARVKGPVLELQVKDGAPAPSWQSVQLTKNEYHRLLYEVAKSSTLRQAILWTRYDWIPNPDGYGVLTVRNAGSFEVRLKAAVTDVLTWRLNSSELFGNLGANCEPLEPDQNALVVANGNAGMRSPSLTYRHNKRPAEHDNDVQDDDHLQYFVQDFVIELDPDHPDVVLGDRRARLPGLIESYLKADTLCVMTVAVEPRGELDFSLPCWLHRQDKDGEVVRVPVGGKDNVPGLNLFDFVPAQVLRKAGVTDPDDERAALVSGYVDIQHQIEREVFGAPVGEYMG